MERLELETEQNAKVMINTAAGSSSRESLAQVLVRTGLISAEQMQSALQIGQKNGKTADQVLVDQKFLTPGDLLTAISIQWKVPLIDLKRHRVHPEILSLIPEQLARKYNVLPLDIIGGALAIVMADVLDVQAIDNISAVTKMRIEPMMAAPDEVRNAIDRNYKVGDTIKAEEEAGTGEASPTVAEAPVIRELGLLIQQALKSRASDIHIMPQKDSLKIRYRIDGVLQDTASLPLSIHRALMSRLKIMATMNITEQRRPQDGQFSISVDGHDVDVRVACGNTIHGEMAVLRLLAKSASLLDLSELGFLPSMLERYQLLLKLPFGMILFGGPTGGGKTTTLYASINQLNRLERNIMTIEDPVEYHLEGINQFQINPKADVRFDNSLRAFMRLDPDVILVGEIRDTETASIATQAALTGHLVLSSIHANDAVGVMFRLLDLGVEPFIVCSALAGTVSQRILRRICTHCRKPYEPATEELAAYKQEMDELPAQFYKGAGCNVCADTGYLGRVAMLEVLIVTEEVRRMLISGATADQIRKQAIQDGMVPLMHDGMLKVKDGITTVSEVLRSTFSIYY
ncbi:MAG: GspE/PulE family protein [Dehalococcoidia bacterium]|nr:GspE/PulE family protein [Dehalococcoidia bacterium]